jgi:cyanophycin synthetase
MEDLTGRLPPEAEALALRAVRALGLRLAGVDLLSPDLAAGVEGAVVLEVNAAPGLDYYAAHGPAQRDRARALVIDALGGQSR